MRVRPPHVPSAFYHVTMRGNARQAIFRDEHDRETLESCLVNAAEHYATEIHAYCWMGNHLHLLLRVSDEPVHQTVRHFASQYARKFNRKYESVGHLFQGRHHRRHVDTDRYLKQVVRYIHRNPVEAGLTAHPGEYRWSSYRPYVGSQACGFLTVDTVLGQFSNSAADARRALADFTNTNPTEPHPWSTWGEIIEAAAARYGVSAVELSGDRRTRQLTEARYWILERATEAELGSATVLAERLGRSASALCRIRKRRTVAD